MYHASRVHAMRLVFITLALFVSAEFSALRAMSGFGCSGVAGSVIFRDTLYGTLTGGLIASVYVLARSDWQGATKQVSSGALIGSVAGFGLGITEILLRDCHEPSRPGMASTASPWHGGLLFMDAPSSLGSPGIAAAIGRRL